MEKLENLMKTIKTLAAIIIAGITLMVVPTNQPQLHLMVPLPQHNRPNNQQYVVQDVPGNLQTITHPCKFNVSELKGRRCSKL